MAVDTPGRFPEWACELCGTPTAIDCLGVISAWCLGLSHTAQFIVCESCYRRTRFMSAAELVRAYTRCSSRQAEAALMFSRGLFAEAVRIIERYRPPAA